MQITAMHFMITDYGYHIQFYANISKVIVTDDDLLKSFTIPGLSLKYIRTIEVSWIFGHLSPRIKNTH